MSHIEAVVLLGEQTVPVTPVTKRKYAVMQTIVYNVLFYI